MCCKQGLKEKKFPAPTEIANQIMSKEKLRIGAKISVALRLPPYIGYQDYQKTIVVIVVLVA